MVDDNGEDDDNDEDDDGGGDDDDDDDDDDTWGESDWVISSVHPISVQLLHSSLANKLPMMIMTMRIIKIMTMWIITIDVKELCFWDLLSFRRCSF